MRQIVVPHRPETRCGSGCMDNGSNYQFFLDGVDTIVLCPSCQMHMFCNQGNVQAVVGALHRTFGYKLMHEREAYYKVRTLCHWSHGDFRTHPLDDLKPAFRSSYTCYFLEDDVESVLCRYATHCKHCGVRKSEFDIESPHGSFLEGWVINPWEAFCSRLCEREALHAWIRDQQRKRREIAWLRKGKKLLVENRRLLRQPPLKSESHHAACRLQPTALRLATTSPIS